MRLTIAFMRAQSTRRQRDRVKDDVSCRDRLIHRLNWNVLSVDEIEQIKIKCIKHQTNTTRKEHIN